MPVRGYYTTLPSGQRVYHAPMTPTLAAALAQAAPATPYDVRIVERDTPHHSIILSLADKPPTPSEGGGGWEEKRLNKRASVLVWVGRGLMKLTMPVVLDGTRDGTPVGGPSWETLLHFWRRENSRGVAVAPPVLRLRSMGDAVLPQPWTNLDWALSDFAWGDGVGDDRAERIQQQLTLTFTEYRQDERLVTAAAAKKAATHLYEVKRGDTLGKIAEHFHVKGGWQALGKMQKPPIYDPRHIKAGQKLIVPGSK